MRMKRLALSNSCRALQRPGTGVLVDACGMRGSRGSTLLIGTGKKRASREGARTETGPGIAVDSGHKTLKGAMPKESTRSRSWLCGEPTRTSGADQKRGHARQTRLRGAGRPPQQRRRVLRDLCAAGALGGVLLGGFERPAAEARGCAWRTAERGSRARRRVRSRGFGRGARDARRKAGSDGVRFSRRDRGKPVIEESLQNGACARRRS